MQLSLCAYREVFWVSAGALDLETPASLNGPELPSFA